MTILSDENPPLTLYQLSHEVTMYDVYDALELLEFKKYLNIEQHNLEQSQQTS